MQGWCKSLIKITAGAKNQELSAETVGAAMMDTAGVKTREHSAGMVGTSQNWNSRYTDHGTQHCNFGNPSQCADPRTRHRNGGNLIIDTAGVQTF